MIAMQIVPPAGRAAPVLVCDGCGDVIEDPMFAGILWPDRLEEGRVGDLLHVELLCKGHCLRRRITQERGKASWREAQEVLAALAHQIGAEEPHDP